MAGLTIDATNWDPLHNFKNLYLNVQLEDELFEEARREVMTGISYAHQKTDHTCVEPKLRFYEQCPCQCGKYPHTLQRGTIA